MGSEKMVEHKIFGFDKLREKIRIDKAKGLKVVLCYGVFNALHIGHMRYLKQAKESGDVLVVVLTAENQNTKDRKQYFEDRRAEALAYLHWIDAVTINDCPDFNEMIQKLRPDVYARGFESVDAGDTFDQHARDEDYMKSIGVRVVIAKEGDFSSTNQINRYISSFSNDLMDYIRLFKQRYSLKDILDSIYRLKNLKVMVIGDTILDEYQYCNAIGKSSKDPTLALKYEGKDLFAGGVLAVANHISSFAGRVDLFSILGEKESYEDFILSELSPNIQPNFVLKPNSPTLIKRRFIDGYSTHKLLEVYVMDDSYLSEEQDIELYQKVKKRLGNYDCVIVTDYGHGAISKKLIHVLTEDAPFLAVNAQSNAGNRGFNTISKYTRADYACLAEHEIRLETRDSTGSLSSLIKILSQNISCKQFAGTRGRKGCMVIDERTGLVQVPSLAKGVVDRVGAGDAFFALTSLLSSISVDGEILGLVGNVAGSLAIEIMGNKKPIDKQSVTDYLEALLSD